jgi:hypothetical protein
LLETVGDLIWDESRAQGIHVPVTVVALLMAAPVSAAKIGSEPSGRACLQACWVGTVAMAGIPTNHWG